MIFYLLLVVLIGVVGFAGYRHYRLRHRKAIYRHPMRAALRHRHR